MENIKIEINFDSPKIKEQIEKITQSAKEGAESLEQAFSENISSDLESINEQIKGITEETNLLAVAATSSTSAFLILSGFIDGFADEFSKVFSGAAAQILGFNKGIFGLTIGLSAASGGFDILAEVLSRTENEFASFLVVIAKVAGVITGGLSFALTLAIVQVGKLAKQIGDELVLKFQQASDVFVKFEKQLILFTKNIVNFNKATDGAVGSTSDWLNEINRLSKELNLSVTSLQKAGTEIISVGTRLGLQEKQLITLNRVVAEYAKLSGKDVFDASVAFVGALNGNARAVTSFGLKLSEASNNQFLLKNGLKDNFRQLTENEKVQVRYNNLLSQFATVSGIAQATSGTLAEQQAKLTVNIENFNRKLGEGASLIENNNIVALAFNKVLNNINDGIVKTVGFFGSFGARLLQVGGFLLTFSFQIIAVTKGIQLLNLALNTRIAQSLLFIKLPLLNKSLITLLSSLAKTKVGIKSFSDIIKVVGRISFISLKSLPSILFNVAKAATLVLIPFLPLIAKFILIGLAIDKVIDAFVILERRTKVFSTVATIASDVIKKAFNFDGISSGLEEFGKVLLRISDIIISFFVASIGFVIEGFLRLAELDPFGVFNNKQIAKIRATADALKKLRTEIAENSFSLVGLSDSVDTNLSKINDSIVNTTNNLNVGLIEGLLTFGTVVSDMFSAIGSNLNTFLELSRQELQQLQNIIGATFARGITNSIKSVVTAISKGTNAFEALGKSLLSLIADLAISVGTFIIALGVAKVAAASDLTGFQTIAAGIGLVAAGAILKAVVGSGFSGGGTAAAGGGGVGATTNAPEFSEETFEAEERVTSVVVNVEGTVLDPVAVGTQIAELIREASEAGSSSIVVNTA